MTENLCFERNYEFVNHRVSRRFFLARLRLLSHFKTTCDVTEGSPANAACLTLISMDQIVTPVDEEEENLYYCTYYRP